MKLLNKIRIFGLGMLATGYLAMLYLFFNAYSYPTKMTLVDINSVGEANLEFILLLVSIIPVILCFLDYIKVKVNQDDTTERG